MSPPWATESVMAKMKELSDYSHSLMFNTKEKNRLSAGKDLFLCPCVDYGRNSLRCLAG